MALAAAAAAALPAPARAQEPVTLRLSGYVPERQTMAVAMRNWAAEIARRTNDKLTFKFFWSSSLLSAADTAQGVRDGRADVGLVAQAYVPSRLPLSTVDSIPFVTANVRAFGHAFVDMYRTQPGMKAEYDKAGLHMIAFLPASINTFYAKAPIRTLADLKNKRIRAIGLGAPALQTVGANPVALAQDQVYEALNKGLLEATSGASLDLGTDFGFHTVAPNVVDPNYGIYASGMFAMNRRLYEGLDPKLRAVLDEMSERFLDDYYFPELDKALADRCDVLKKANATIFVWDQAESDAWRNAIGDTARQQWIKTASSASGTDAAAFLSAYEAKVRQYEKAMPSSPPLRVCLEGKS
jgi:TRAP-type C4-dicarboxylate transport system substrate-binding protein